jgi:LPXTG-motif cell wall-anchored protein
VSDGWVAADLDDQHYRGELVESSCSAGHGRASTTWAGGLLAAMIGLLGWLGRRRNR